MALARHSDEVLDTFLTMAGREEFMVATELVAAVQAIVELSGAWGTRRTAEPFRHASQITFPWIRRRVRRYDRSLCIASNKWMAHFSDADPIDSSPDSPRHSKKHSA